MKLYNDTLHNMRFVAARINFLREFFNLAAWTAILAVFGVPMLAAFLFPLTIGLTLVVGGSIWAATKVGKLKS